MKSKYLCPKCRLSVNVGDQIILTGKTRNGLKGIIILKSKLGDYTTLFSDDFTVFESNKLSLSCPICHVSLAANKNKDLAHLLMIDDENKEANIFFSQVVGEKCTYKIKDNQITKSYGEHKNRYKPDWLIDNL